jgi:hypothetical protein
MKRLLTALAIPALGTVLLIACGPVSAILTRKYDVPYN